MSSPALLESVDVDGWQQYIEHGTFFILKPVIELQCGNTDAREKADRIINRLVANNIRSLPGGFRTYQQTTLSPYRGRRVSGISKIARSIRYLLGLRSPYELPPTERKQKDRNRKT